MAAIIITAKFKGENSEKYQHGESYLLRVNTDKSNGIEIQQLIEKIQPHEKVDYVAVKETLIKYDSIVTFLYLWDEITSYPTIDLDEVF